MKKNLLLLIIVVLFSCNSQQQKKHDSYEHALKVKKYIISADLGFMAKDEIPVDTFEIIYSGQFLKIKDSLKREILIPKDRVRYIYKRK